jgi:hypothetical protein
MQLMNPESVSCITRYHSQNYFHLLLSSCNGCDILGLYMYRVCSSHGKLCCKSQVNWELFFLIVEGSELKVI